MWLYTVNILREDVILLKKRDFFTILAAGAVVALGVQALWRWLSDEFGQEDYYDLEDEELDDLDDAALDELLDATYDDGFADGCNADYQGFNPAAQVLQAKLDQLLDECTMDEMLDESVECQCGAVEPDEPEGAENPN